MKHLHFVQKAGLALLMLALAACSAVGSAQTLPQEETQTVPTQADPTQPEPAPTEGVPAAVLAAQQWLAQQLGRDVALVELGGYEAAEWPDGCLGLGQAHESCLAALTPGYEVALIVAGVPFTLRTDETGEAVRVAPPEEAGELDGTAWQLVSFESNGVVTAVAAPGSITLTFGTDGQAGGNGGCNSFGGLYRAQGGRLLFGLISSTLMACADPDLMGQETQFYEALQSASAYELSEQGLTITHANGTLTLAPLAAVEALPEARVPGIVDFYEDGTAGVITAPETVPAGQAFDVLIATFGSGCERAAEAEVVVGATGADVLVYDFTSAVSPEVACEQMLLRLDHTVTVQFDEPGEKVIRVWGRRVGAEAPGMGVPVVIEHTVTVE